jgi:hypothetical protein
MPQTSMRVAPSRWLAAASVSAALVVQAPTVSDYHMKCRHRFTVPRCAICRGRHLGVRNAGAGVNVALSTPDR